MVDLLQELTDIDTLHESEEGAEVLIDALVSMSVFDYIDEAALCGVWALKRAERNDKWYQYIQWYQPSSFSSSQLLASL